MAEFLGAGGISAPAGAVKRPKTKKSAKAPPEPHGQGLRVVMQRIPGVTASGVLEEPFMFQVAPLEEYATQYGWDFTDYDTIGAGYHTRPGSAQLATISFDSLFVDSDYSFVINKKLPYNPVELTEQLKALGDSRTPFQLVAGQQSLWGAFYDTNMAATLRQLRVSEKMGERDARYFSISFTEFRGISQDVLNAGLRGDVTKQGNRVVAVLPVDKLTDSLSTLRLISKHYYGTTTLWDVIAKASGLSAPGSVDLRQYYKGAKPPPKVTVPAVQRKG